MIFRLDLCLFIQPHNVSVLNHQQLSVVLTFVLSQHHRYLNVYLVQIECFDLVYLTFQHDFKVKQFPKLNFALHFPTSLQISNFPKPLLPTI